MGGDSSSSAGVYEAYISVSFSWDREFPDVFCFFGIYVQYYLCYFLIDSNTCRN